MINEETRRKLREINLGEAIKGLEVQQADPATIRYVRLPDLLMEYGDSTVVSGNQRKLLERYSRIPLLILDEWLVSDISDAELLFLFELMERRSDTTSTIFCTQYRKDDWVKRLGEGVRAEAIVDRYAYTAFWIETGSTNMREYCAKHKM